MSARLFVIAGLISILLASCTAPTTASVPTALATPTVSPITPIPHSAELRFALIGAVSDVNVWALFDSKGYSYNNYATHYETWPHLYQLSIPSREFETMAASDMPSVIQQDGNFFSAAVPLRTDLKWTDGSPFTAEDAAFTANTSLKFQLGFDWHDFYNPDYLDHVEAIDSQTVKFVFKKQPNVGIWQYGALQGPIVQKAYWSPKISAAEKLLPGDSSTQIAALQAQINDLQNKINVLNLKISTTVMNPDDLKKALSDLKAHQDDLNSASRTLEKVQDKISADLSAARELLYAIPHENEPTLGNWIPVGMQNGAWINKVNPSHPFGTPNFDEVSYKFFQDEKAAFTALTDNSVDAILSPDGLPYFDSVNPKYTSVFTTKTNPNNSLHFLALNLSNPTLSDSKFRNALSCILDRSQFESTAASGEAMSLESFVLPSGKFWLASNLKPPCTNNTTGLQLSPLQLLQGEGYSWSTKPGELPAYGMKSPNGQPIPNLELLASKFYIDTSPENDPFRTGTMYGNAIYRISFFANFYGFNITDKPISPEEFNFAVFDSGQYDMALIGWRVSEYPGYLCEWFGDGNPFHYDGSRLKSACEALNSTTDLNETRNQVYEIQSVLAQDLPMIPLYSGITYDAYRNISYPFDSVRGGLSGVYGAPSLAIPASH